MFLSHIWFQVSGFLVLLIAQFTLHAGVSHFYYYHMFSCILKQVILLVGGEMLGSRILATDIHFPTCGCDSCNVCCEPFWNGMQTISQCCILWFVHMWIVDVNALKFCGITIRCDPHLRWIILCLLHDTSSDMVFLGCGYIWTYIWWFGTHSGILLWLAQGQQ
jgi:hypothetical protein